MIDECETCQKMTEWYLKEHPQKRGFMMCEDCYEKSKEFFVYLKSEEKNPTIIL